MQLFTSRITLAFAALFAIALASCSSGGTVPTTPGHSIGTLSSVTRSLKCFTQDTGTCSISKDGTVSLFLPNPPPADAAAGVYFAADNSLNGVTLAKLKALSFGLSGPYQAGSPRVSISVTYNGSPTTAYIYPVSCTVLNSGSGSAGPNVDPVGNPADTDNSYCLEMQGYSNPQYWSSWSDFIATYGSAVISAPPWFLADADDASGGTWTLTNITTKK